MRKLYWTVKIISAMVGLVFLANMTVPGWQSMVAKKISAAVAWGSQEAPPAAKWTSTTLAKINKQAQSGATVSAPSVSPSPAAVVLSTPPPAATTAPAAEQGPPPATSLNSVGQATWSNSVCQTMIEDMSWDSSLDNQTATSDGSTNPTESAYYATWSGHWQTVVNDMNTGPCAATQQPLSGVQCTGPEQWFQTAILGHQTDEAANPQNKSWDNEWIATYQQLASLWPAAGCS